MNNKQRSKAIIDMLLEENKELKRQLKRVKDSYASILKDKLSKPKEPPKQRIFTYIDDDMPPDRPFGIW